MIIPSVKRLIKRRLQAFAANYGRHTRKPDEPELLLLMYHRILPASDSRSSREEPGMMVTPETFRQHMIVISSMFQTINLSQWLRLKENNEKMPPRCCAITFDDGWADNYEFAYPILKEMNIPATIFLVSDMIATDSKFWPERLSHILTTIAQKCPQQWTHDSLEWITKTPGDYDFGSTVPTQEQLSEIIAHIKNLRDDDIHRRLDQIEQQLQLNDEITAASLLDWDQVNEMCASGIIEIGSHTCHHVRLTAGIDSSQLEHEIVSSKKTIEEKTGQKVETFCYPNGDYCEKALSLVKQHYAGAVTTQSGWNTLASENHLLNRIGVHEDISSDRTSFLSRLSGWL